MPVIIDPMILGQQNRCIEMNKFLMRLLILSWLFELEFCLFFREIGFFHEEISSQNLFLIFYWFFVLNLLIFFHRYLWLIFLTYFFKLYLQILIFLIFSIFFLILSFKFFILIFLIFLIFLVFLVFLVLLRICFHFLHPFDS